MAPQSPEHETREGRIGLRTALILLFACISGVVIAGLRWVGGDHPATALAIGLATVGAAYFAFDKLIE
ncbi:hypothetical protein [Nocardiopsis deserti]|jgi:hypothetical protein|uniref:hypothetical protein n=1 Tax=Nocardiopsis deserti TaxID=2605988 RepID=UPI00123B8FC4|nr:hypothetical protein [Nocardiopsis deserti]